jgi:hypothetical protein
MTVRVTVTVAQAIANRRNGYATTAIATALRLVKPVARQKCAGSIDGLMAGFVMIATANVVRPTGPSVIASHTGAAAKIAPNTHHAKAATNLPVTDRRERLARVMTSDRSVQARMARALLAGTPTTARTAHVPARAASGRIAETMTTLAAIERPPADPSPTGVPTLKNKAAAKARAALALTRPGRDDPTGQVTRQAAMDRVVTARAETPAARQLVAGPTDPTAEIGVPDRVDRLRRRPPDAGLSVWNPSI